MTNDKLILSPKLRKTIILAIVCLAFTIGGIFMSKEERLQGLLVAGFFGFGLLVCIVQLLPGSAKLTLTNEGFIMTSLFRSHLIKWSDIEVFKIGYLGNNQVVMFDFTDEHKKYETGKLIAKSLTDSHAALPSTYGLDVTELFALMNEWKYKYS